MGVAVAPSFDRTGLLNAIKDGYYRTAMAAKNPDTLKREQAGRARAEERFAREATQPAEERAHQRRADKAAYLRDKLAEAERADREAERQD
jgi:hypothetical protein